MAGFDPAAATAAWVAHVPPALQAAAERRAHVELIAWAAGAIAPLLLAIPLLRFGVVERTWRWGALGGPARGAAAVAVLLAASGAGIDVAVRVLAGVETAPGAAQDLCRGLLGRGVLLFGLWMALSLAGRRPRLGLSVLAAAASFALVFGPEAVGEFTAHGGVAAPVQVAAAALDVARSAGVRATSVEVSADAPGEGDVRGLLKPPRILIAPAAASGGPPEVKAAVGHVLGHWTRKDQLGFALLLSSLGVGGVLVVGALQRPLGRRIGGAYALGDPRSLPALWALAAAWLALAGPAVFAWDRAINLRADRFSLEHAREPDGLAQALVRENGLAPVDPPLIERWIVCSHPPLKARIAQAMAWKAAHAR